MVGTKRPSEKYGRWVMESAPTLYANGSIYLRFGKQVVRVQEIATHHPFGMLQEFRSEDDAEQYMQSVGMLHGGATAIAAGSKTKIGGGP